MINEVIGMPSMALPPACHLRGEEGESVRTLLNHVLSSTPFSCFDLGTLYFQAPRHTCFQASPNVFS